MHTVIVGDVHGCLDELLKLVALCGDPGGTRYVLVGDVCAKGPDSQGVIQWARETGADAVLGNHDAHVLHVRDTGTDDMPKAHHADVAKTLSPDDWKWLEARPLWLPVDEVSPHKKTATSHIIVHGGLVPGVKLEEQERLFLLNLRSIKPDGNPSKKLDGTPWASLWRGPPHAVFGHDAVRGLQRHTWATGLDTGCVYGRELSALVLPSNQIVSVPARHTYAPMK